MCEFSKIFNITSKYFSIIDNKAPASWVAYITRCFYCTLFCLYYSIILKYHSFSPFVTIKEWFVFHDLSMFGNISRMHFLFLTYKTLRAIVTLFFSNFFQSSFPDANFISSQLYWFLLFFVDFFGFLRDFTWLVQCIENICYFFYFWDLLLLFLFFFPS